MRGKSFNLKLVLEREAGTELCAIKIKHFRKDLTKPSYPVRQWHWNLRATKTWGNGRSNIFESTVCDLS